MRMILLIAFRNLKQAKRRTFFLSVAIGVVTLFLVLLLALSQGITENLIRSATTLMTGHVNVAGFYKATATDASPIVVDAPKVRAIVEEKTPGLQFVVERNRGWATLISPTDSLTTSLVGVDPSEMERLELTVELAAEKEYLQGGRPRIVGDITRLAQPNTIAIFAEQARRLDVTVGDPLTIRANTFKGETNTLDVTVVAVGEDLGLLSNFAVFLPKQAVLELYQLKPSTTGAIQIFLDDIERAPEVAEYLREALEGEGYALMDYRPKEPFFAKFESVSGEDWLGQKLDITLWGDEVSFATWVINALDTISALLIGVLVVIIAIGIMNTMWISVRERTGEIGTVRAVGMSRLRVLALFLVEAVILGFAASALGASLGALVSLAIDAAAFEAPIDAMKAILLSDTIHLAVEPSQLVRAVGLLTTFTAISALWPAIRAARMQPVEAIRQGD